MMLTILKNLQKEITVFLISIAVASTIIISSYTWWQAAFDEKNLANIELDNEKKRYYTALNQKQLLKEFESQYDTLKGEGIIGDENRLNWVDTIEKITANNKIPYLKYSLDKRQLFKSNFLNINYPGIQLYQSAMKLNMQLLHEGDLYTIINSLHNQAKGLFDINHCTINRNNTMSETLLTSTTSKNFSAECELNWYTIHKKPPPAFDDSERGVDQ